MFQQLINHKVTEEERVADSAWLQGRHGKPVTKQFKRTSHNNNYLRVKSFAKSHSGFRKVVEERSWLIPLLVATLGRKKYRLSHDVASLLVDLTNDEGDKIGSSLKPILITSTQPSAGVEEWILKYPALVELDAAEDWFRPFMIEVGTAMVLASNFGLKYRNW